MHVVIPVAVEGDKNDTHMVELTTDEAVGLTQILGMNLEAGLIMEDRVDAVLGIIRKIGVAVVGEEAMDKARQETLEQYRQAVLERMDIDPTA